MKRKRGSLQWDVLACLEKNGIQRPAEIARALKTSEYNVRYCLTTLKKQGEVENPKWGFWALPEEQTEPEENPVISQPFGPTDGFGNSDIPAIVSELNRWLAWYSGPGNDPVAVEIVLAKEHMERAMEYARGEAVRLPNPPPGKEA